jgi:thiamine-phosphate pyrophosphorylase
MMRRVEDCRLYAFIDTGYTHGRSVALLARELCAGGADIIQLRAKNSPVNEIRKMAEDIVQVTGAAGVPLVINDHLQVALEVSAELVHLGQEDFFDAGYAHVSAIVPVGSALRVGLSTHAPEQATRALAAGAAYVAIGPVYPTGTKPGARPVTLDYVRWAAANVRIPWFAIGGINLENLEAVLLAGAQRVCAVSAILNAPDVAAECGRFKELLKRYPLNGGGECGRH